MKISVVMVDGGFREHFHLIESLNKQTFQRDEFEVLWVEYYSEVSAKLKEKPGVKIITLGNRSDAEYHSSYCFNAGIRHSSGEVVVIPDADVLVEPTFLDTIWREHQACNHLAMYFHRMNEPEEVHDINKSYNLDYIKNLTKVTTTSNYGGCLTVRKKWLMEINGYEQDHVFGSGAHANGYDVNTRLKNLGLHVMWHPSERLYHPWHPGSETTSAEGELRYRLQHMITEFRASTMMTKAFQGVNSDIDSAMPQELLQKLDAVREGGVRNKKVWRRVKSKIKLMVS